jgi:predicted phosphodiesterase
VSLEESLANPPVTVPSKYQKRAEYDTDSGKGEGATGPVRVKITDHRQLLELAGFDPDNFRIVGRIAQWTKTHHDREDTYSFFFQTEIIRDEEESSGSEWLASLIRPVKPVKPPKSYGLPMVVCLADGQIGKDGPDATGPEDLENRYQSALAKVAGMVKAQRPSVLVLADNGDPIEGITSSAPNQIATNWLEFPEQLQAWQRRLTEAILTLSPFAGETHVAAVPSNHGEVRNTAGKVGYGDHGIGVAKTVEEAFSLLAPDRFDLTFHYPPSKYDVNTYVDVDGTVVAFTHGHHAGSIDRIPQWIANQAASTRSPMADARIVCHGHFHQPGYRESRGRAIVSCSMFDAGSAWFENKTGEHSRPSITTFSVKDSRVYELRFVEP